MSGFKSTYKIGLRAARSKIKETLRESELGYSIFKNKDSDYARSIKALQDLHRQVSEIYDSADDDIFADDQPF